MSDITVKTSPSSPGAMYALTMSGTSGTPVTGALDNTGQAGVSLDPGIYDLLVTPSDPSLAPVSQSVNTDDGEATVQMVATDDPAASTQPPATTGGTTTGTVVAPSSPNASTVDPEFIFPGTASGYVTATQAKMYIGNLFIDELNYVQFALQDNKIPIYGYRSRYFDALAQGHSLVSGQLGVNFVTEGYLYTILKNFQSGAQTPDPGASQSSTDAATLQGLLQQLSSYQSSGNGDDPAVDAINAQIDALCEANPNNVDLANQATSSTSAPTPLPGAGMLNATYLDIPFDLVLKIGPNNTVRRLEKCFLTGNEQIFDQSGVPIVDAYSFIARRLR